ncbi:MAG: type II toxin-antitoxin system RelE/ParE family toxin [Proteobacteria bacterium]|nr:type II toxin-antitoxin system RelE/ParE family toxin [Pseudomonadota bacterium]
MAYSSGWRVIFLRVARKEMRKQPKLIRTKFERLLEVIKRQGFDGVPSHRFKQLTRDIWELRVWGKDTTARSLYLKRDGVHVIIVRVFTKKDPKTPPSEIRLAQQRAKEYDHAE